MSKRYFNRDGVYDTAINDYASTSAIVYKLNKMADLEAKLTELQECVLRANAKHNLEMQNAQICIKELEAKLAESEEKLYQANSRANELECNLELLNKCLIKNEEIINANNQDKISFAVEQLEKVKEELDKHDKIETFVDIYGDSAVNRSDLEFFIDNQIKQLKEQQK